MVRDYFEEAPREPTPTLIEDSTPAEYNVTVHVSLPRPGLGYIDYDPYDRDLSHNISNIQKKMHVRIERTWDGSSATIFAFTKRTAREALLALEKALREAESQASTWTHQVIIAVPKYHESVMQLVLLGEESHGIPLKAGNGVRPVVHLWAPPAAQSNTMAMSLANATYQRDLKETLSQLIRDLSRVPCKMRMKVHFGHLLLQEWKKTKFYYSLPEMKELTHRAGLRGTARMDELIGDLPLVPILRKLFASAADKSVPLPLGSDYYSKVKRVRSMILVTKDLVLESVIEMTQVSGKVGDNSKALLEHTFSPFRVFHHSSKNLHSGVITACPESSHDWVLEVQKQLGPTEVENIPFSSDTLQKIAKFAYRGDSELPTFSLPESFMKQYRIQNVLDKISWTYALNPKYNVEIIEYRKWGTDLTVPPSGGAGLSIHSTDWNDAMPLANLALGPREWKDFGETFLKVHRGPAGQEVDAYANFFENICRVQDTLETARKLARESKKS